MSIEKAAVLGAGTMGSQIAAHLANAGADVILMDIVPDDAGNRRNKLPEKALEKLRKKGKAFTHPDNAARILPGNFEDDMDELETCDWIIEAVVEEQEIKKDLYQRVDQYRKQGSIVSSNTSTIPLKKLKEGQSPELKNDLVITHFFNPPRKMRLLELVSGKTVKENGHLQNMIDFADRKLGKTVVEVRDTPGFIGNRLGVFWMLTGLQQALEQDVAVPVVDKIIGEKLGFPKTGIFGLFDLIGVDLMKELGQSLRDQLRQEDGYHNFDKALEFLENFEEDGFYKKENGKKLVWNLQSGGYEEPPSHEMDKDLSLSNILDADNERTRYARAVLLRTLNYACACLPEIAGSVEDVDTVMRLGFNWEHGPFEMIDALGNGQNGSAVLIEALEKEGLDPADLLKRFKLEPFYKEQKGTLYFLAPKDGYKPKIVAQDQWKLKDKVRGAEPVLENSSARLWDIGDGIACFEFTNEHSTMDPPLFDLLDQAVEKVESEFAGLIIGHDRKLFSAGLDLQMTIKLCEQEKWNELEDILKRGQKMMRFLYAAPFPVVGAPSGKALGGACEMLLHCDGVQAHIESHIGLVEQRIGIVPSWGGCTQMLARHLRGTGDEDKAKEICGRVFKTIAQAKTSGSGQTASQQLGFKDNFRVTMNRERVLPEAKELCRKLAQDYSPPAKGEIIKVPESAGEAYQLQIEEMDLKGYDWKVRSMLAFVLSGGQVTENTSFGKLDVREDSGFFILKPQQLMDLERQACMALLKNADTQRKIRKTLKV